MLYEYQLAYVSVPHYPCFPFINILLAQAGMCVSCPHAKVSHRHVLLMILIFLSSLSPPSSILLLSLSLAASLSRRVPLQSAHLPLIIFHYIYFQVCLQKCPCSHPPPLLPCFYLSNPLLSFPLQSSVDSCTLRLDQLALRFLSCPLLHCNLVFVFHLDAPLPQISSSSTTPVSFLLPRHSCLGIPFPLPCVFFVFDPPLPTNILIMF